MLAEVSPGKSTERIRLLLVTPAEFWFPTRDGSIPGPFWPLPLC